MSEHFCDCPNTKCARHPRNHDQGCTPCIQDNLEKKKMPACFFGLVNEDMSAADDYTIDGFVRFYQKYGPVTSDPSPEG